jgi:putative oxidoreductase
MNALLELARIVFALLFINSGINHLTKLEAMTGYAKYKKLPAAKLGVILSGIAIFLAGIGIVIGFWVDLSAIVLAVFLVLATVIFHQFWKETDATAKMNETIAFFKDFSLAGAAVIIYGYAHAAYQMWMMGSQMHQSIKIFGWAVYQHIALFH